MSHAGVLPSRRSVISGLHSFGEGHGACRFRAGLVPCFPAATRSITSANCPHLELMRVRQQRRPTSGTVTRSDRGLIEALRQQFELLKSACSSYDEGNELEVINIATRLRVILQGPQSLIGQLHLSKDLKFRDTSTHRLDPEGCR